MKDRKPKREAPIPYRPPVKSKIVDLIKSGIKKLGISRNEFITKAIEHYSQFVEKEK